MRSESERLHYRSKFEVVPYTTTEPALPAITRCIYEWISRKESYRRGQGEGLYERLASREGKEAFLGGDLSLPDDYQGGASEDARSSLAVRGFRDEEGTLVAWAMEYDEAGHEPTRFCRWHTCIGLFADDDACKVNVKVTNYEMPGYFGPAYRPFPRNVPKVVRDILTLEGYESTMGDSVVKEGLVTLSEENFDGEFAENLLSPERQLPMILVNTDREGRSPMPDPERFADLIMGTANVYLADWSDPGVRRRIFALFVKGEPAYHYGSGTSSLRVYLPSIDLRDAHDSRRHRYFVRATLKELTRGAADEDGGDGLVGLSDIMSRGLSRHYFTEPDDVVDLTDIERLRRARAIARQRERLRQRAADRELENREALRRFQALAQSSEETEQSLRGALGESSGEISRLNQALEELNRDQGAGVREPDALRARHQRVEAHESQSPALAPPNAHLRGARHRVQVPREGRLRAQERPVPRLRAPGRVALPHRRGALRPHPESAGTRYTH